MKKLLNTLFVTSEDAYLTLDGENVVVNREKQVTARFPLHALAGIISFSYAGASPALMAHAQNARERGLKSSTSAVPPNSDGSLPSRERGLKFCKIPQRRERFMSLPSRERGLKRDGERCHNHNAPSLLSRKRGLK